MNFNIRMSRAMSNAWIIRLTSLILFKISKSARARSHKTVTSLSITTTKTTTTTTETTANTYDVNLPHLKSVPKDDLGNLFQRAVIIRVCVFMYVCSEVCMYARLICFVFIYAFSPFHSVLSLCPIHSILNGKFTQFTIQISSFSLRHTRTAYIWDNLVYFFHCIALCWCVTQYTRKLRSFSLSK